MENKIEVDKNTYIKISKIKKDELSISVVVDYDDKIYSISLDLNEENVKKLKKIINED